MSTDEAQGDMWIIAQRAAVRDICLVCYEGAEHGEMCHRFLLLDMICNIAKNNGINIHVRKTGISQTNKFIKSKKQELDLFDF
jgi:purine-nucleoside phosphorylase